MDTVSKKTTNGTLVVDIVGHAEPNNGRSLWKVNVLYNNTNINEKLFSNNWNYINERIDHWQQEGFGYVYIPVEGTAKLIHLDILEIHDLIYERISTVSFIGNSFQCNKLMEVYSDVIKITDLATLQTRLFNYKNLERVENATFLNEKEIEVHLVKYKGRNHEKRTEIRRI
ncbi:hypothetical protein [uncultured Kordia sp.]|uniref:hypothetical protein n=1 Tax=uncultured Kordia sp. TaxID=507699 RepID=UPI0026128390|nr:hypothetical protein [uncultured Kordia sp.]